jgi:ribosomal protein L39E
VVVNSPEIGERLFFLDSGYSISTCDDDFADEIGLHARGRVLVRGEAGTLHAKRVRLPSFTFGGHRVDRLACVVRDLGHTSSIADPPEVSVAGVLGADFLRKFHVILDPARAELTLAAPRRSDLDPSQPGVVPIRREFRVGTRFTVPIGVNGKTTRPVVDTGATNTHVDGERLDLRPDGPPRTVAVRGSGATGETTRQVLFFKVDQLLLGTVLAGPFVITDRPRGPGASGLLGLDVIGNLRHEYDFKKRLARFSKVDEAAVPAWVTWKKALKTETAVSADREAADPP